jgi:hypothetical protein
LSWLIPNERSGAVSKISAFPMWEARGTSFEKPPLAPRVLPYAKHWNLFCFHFVSRYLLDITRETQKKKKQGDSKSKMLTRATISFFKWRADSI